MSFIENFAGGIAFFTSVIGLLPQVYKSIQTKSTDDLSMLMLFNYAICSIAWIIYGDVTHSMYVLYSNVLGLLSSVILIVLKKYYDKKAIASNKLVLESLN